MKTTQDIPSMLNELTKVAAAAFKAEQAVGKTRKALKELVERLQAAGCGDWRISEVISAIGKRDNVPAYTISRVLVSAGIRRIKEGSGRKAAETAPAPAAETAPAPAAETAPAPAAETAPAPAAETAPAPAPAAETAPALPKTAPDAAAAVIAILQGLPRAKRKKAWSLVAEWNAKN